MEGASEFSVPIFFITSISVLFLFFLKLRRSSSPIYYGPKSYPIVGAAWSISKHRHRLPHYIADLIHQSPTLTITIYRPFGSRQIITANPSNVEHILKTKFHAYPKGPGLNSVLHDFLGDGIFNADGDKWKIQRKIASYEFSTRSLRRFVDVAVKSEISNRLLPLLASAAASKTVLDLQDMLQKFAFDNICKIAFGSDPGCLDPNFSDSGFTVAFDEAVRRSSQRFNYAFWLTWKIMRALRVRSEKSLQDSIRIVNEYAMNIIRQRKEQQPVSPPSSESEDADLLSRFIDSGYEIVNERFVKDMIVSFILAGRDTTSAALTWFFWLVSGHQRVEEEILREISCVGNSEVVGFEEVKELNYLHAAVYESMRLYPPVPSDSKEAAEDDVLPDGTIVPKGTRIAYHPYSMGRSEALWGKDWEEFRPERWLEREESGGKWQFLPEDPYKYPVFQAGPRVCLGKDMALVQMKSIAAAVLRRFRVIPALPAFEPVYVGNMTSKMEGGFPVRVEERKT